MLLDMATSVEQIVRFLIACRKDESLVLPGLGRIGVKRYVPYTGRNPLTGEAADVPATRLPFFTVDRELDDRVNGRPPSGRSSKRGPPWAVEVAASVTRDLHASGLAEVAGLGTFDVMEKAGRRIVRFKASDDLKRRLNESS